MEDGSCIGRVLFLSNVFHGFLKTNLQMSLLEMPKSLQRNNAPCEILPQEQEERCIMPKVWEAKLQLHFWTDVLSPPLLWAMPQKYNLTYWWHLMLIRGAKILSWTETSGKFRSGFWPNFRFYNIPRCPFSKSPSVLSKHCTSEKKLRNYYKHWQFAKCLSLKFCGWF